MLEPWNLVQGWRHYHFVRACLKIRWNLSLLFCFKVHSFSWEEKGQIALRRFSRTNWYGGLKQKTSIPFEPKFIKHHCPGPVCRSVLFILLWKSLFCPFLGYFAKTLKNGQRRDFWSWTYGTGFAQGSWTVVHHKHWFKWNTFSLFETSIPICSWKLS